MSQISNLRKTAVSLAMFAVVALASALTAKADPVTLINGGASHTFIYQSANFPDSNASATFSLNGNILTVVLSNTSTEATSTELTAIGFNTTPNVTVSNFVGTGVTSGWTANGALGAFEVSRNGQGIGEAITQGGSETLTFTLLNFSGNLTIDLTQVHIQSLPDGGSEKPPGNGNGTPVPEPASMLLLGTGLAGLAAGIRRRLRK